MRSIILVAGLVPACTAVNPAFDVAGKGTTSTGTTSTGSSGAPTTTRPTTGSETSGASTDASGASTDASGATTDAASSEASTASTAITASTASTDATTDTSTDTTTDTTTGAPASCWEQGAANWPPDGALLTFADASPVDPFLSPDGLGLYYVAHKTRRPFLSTRADLLAPFPNGVQQTIWGNDPAITVGYPRVVLAGTEMLLASNFEVYSATATPGKTDKFALPVKLAPPSTADEETVITATADSAILIVSRRDGPPIGDIMGASHRFYQYTRAQLQPGAAYVGGADVTPLVEPLGLALCPTLSPDGLHLFFGSTESNSLTMQSAHDVVGIYYTSRADPSMAWEPAQKLAIEHQGKGITCPSSVTADGCQLAFHRFYIGEDKYSMHLAVRLP